MAGGQWGNVCDTYVLQSLWTTKVCSGRKYGHRFGRTSWGTSTAASCDPETGVASCTYLWLMLSRPSDTSSWTRYCIVTRSMAIVFREQTFARIRKAFPAMSYREANSESCPERARNQRDPEGGVWSNAAVPVRHETFMTPATPAIRCETNHPEYKQSPNPFIAGVVLPRRRFQP